MVPRSAIPRRCAAITFFLAVILAGLVAGSHGTAPIEDLKTVQLVLFVLGVSAAAAGTVYAGARLATRTPRK